MVDEREIIQIESHSYLTIFEKEDPVTIKIDESYETQILEVFLGTKGERGEQIELRSDGLSLQSKYSNEDVWVDIFDLSSLQGEDGKPIEIGFSSTHLQWRYAGDIEWSNLISIEDLRGPAYIHPATHSANMIEENSEKVFVSLSEKTNLLDMYEKKDYVHNQISSSDIWVVSHNLSRFPSVFIVDTGGNVVYGDIEYVDTNTIRLYFTGAFSGKAFLN